ncbi:MULTISPECIES: FtsX-like permease family protein [Pseudoalteromonas]|uniref:ABC transporter permease n=1 Tax=Pseudoalteromonas TaxID=53246 RepID=UPI000FFEAA7B|nr:MULTISPECIES: FtsX-like permease family protein [Pseudoalteromonas]NKC18527.1 FtsX-like permease family protein [Pseudoalteromonas galatheae]RXE84937.1 ABC transporter permease [Pseudoalteromonas sp. A757]
MAIKHILKLILKQKSISLLIILQIAITVMIVSNTAFISYATLQNWLIPSKLEEQQILNVTTRVFDTSVNVQSLIEKDIQAIENVPGVIGASYAGRELVLNSLGPGWTIFKDTQPETDYSVFGYFGLDEKGVDVLGLELVEGRRFYASEFIKGDETTKNAGVIMISDDLATSLFGDSSALGKSVYISRQRIPHQVVGVYKGKMLGESATYSQQPYNSGVVPEVIWGNRQRANYLVRVEEGVSERILEEVETALYHSEGRMVERVEFVARAKKRLWDGRSTFALTMAGISGIACVVTALGIVALVSFSVSLRKKDHGVLRALGASKGKVMWSLIKENTILVCIGLVLGFGLSILLYYFLMNNVRVQSVVEIPLLVGVAIFTWLVSTLAVYLPAKEAAKVSPAQVTKSS